MDVIEIAWDTEDLYCQRCDSCVFKNDWRACLDKVCDAPARADHKDVYYCRK